MQHSDLVASSSFSRDLPPQDQANLSKKRRRVQLLFYSALENETVEKTASKNSKKVHFPSPILHFSSLESNDEDDLEDLEEIIPTRTPPSSPTKHCEWDDHWQEVEPKFEEMRMAVGLATQDELSQNLKKLKETKTKLQRLEIARVNRSKQVKLHDAFESSISESIILQNSPDTSPNHVRFEETHQVREFETPELKGILLKTRTSPPQDENVKRGTKDDVNLPELMRLGIVIQMKLLTLELERLHEVECSKCQKPFPAEELLIGSVEEGNEDLFVLGKCINCASEDDIDLEGMRGLFEVLKTNITEEWAKFVEERMLNLFGSWEDTINPLLSEIYGDLLHRKEIENLLMQAENADDFQDSCATVIETIQQFSLDMHDFQCCAQELFRRKKMFEFEDHFALFKIYFPERNRSRRA